MRGLRHVLLVALVAATPFGASLLLVEHPALRLLPGLALPRPAVALLTARAGPAQRPVASTRP